MRAAAPSDWPVHCRWAAYSQASAVSRSPTAAAQPMAIRRRAALGPRSGSGVLATAAMWRWPHRRNRESRPARPAARSARRSAACRRCSRSRSERSRAGRSSRVARAQRAGPSGRSWKTAGHHVRGGAGASAFRRGSTRAVAAQQPIADVGDSQRLRRDPAPRRRPHEQRLGVNVQLGSARSGRRNASQPIVELVVRPSGKPRRAEPDQAGESAGDNPRAGPMSARRAAPASSGPRAPGSRPRFDTARPRPARTARRAGPGWRVTTVDTAGATGFVAGATGFAAVAGAFDCLRDGQSRMARASFARPGPARCQVG